MQVEKTLIRYCDSCEHIEKVEEHIVNMKKFKADLPADVSFSNALEGVHSSGMVHKCSHREDKKTVSAVRFHA